MDQIPGLIDFALKSFTFKPFYTDQAAATIRRISAKMRGSSGPPGDLLYVGVHNRRTDHLQYQREGGWVPLQPGYFLEALDLYRDWRWPPTTRILFLFVSDDPHWAEERLVPRVKTKGT